MISENEILKESKKYIKFDKKKTTKKNKCSLFSFTALLIIVLFGIVILQNISIRKELIEIKKYFIFLNLKKNIENNGEYIERNKNSTTNYDKNNNKSENNIENNIEENSKNNNNIKTYNNNYPNNTYRHMQIKIEKESFFFHSYAQYLEDLILLGFLYDVKNGFYVDVGANDPVKDSVTKYFYLNGWNGINIEPLEDKYELLMKDRPRDVNLNIVASNKNGNVTLYINEGLTTTKQNYSKISYPKRIVKAQKMSEILETYVPKDTKIQFCKIDVEGAEKEVLLGYDFEKFRPKVFVIESTLPLTLIPTYQTFEDILIKNDFSYAYNYSVNRFYIDNREQYLKERILNITELVNYYKNNNK